MKNTTTILVAALLIAGSLVFLGLRMSGTDKEQKTFAEQLKDYEAQQQQKQIEAQQQQEQLAQEKAKKVAPIDESDHVYGEKDALITIYEYSDFECPYCKGFSKTPAQLVKNNKAKVNTVFRHFPLDFHDPLATKEALASECAAEQGKFWEYHDELFNRTNSNGRGLKISELYKIAKDLKIKDTQFRSCLDTEKYMDKIKKDIASGTLAGVRGTPGNIIKNNKTGNVVFIPGALPIENFQEAIDGLINE